MPETKNLTLEQIDTVLAMPTRDLIRQNWSKSVKTASNLARLRFREVVSDARLANKETSSQA
jgi:hypothetical protein